MPENKRFKQCILHIGTEKTGTSTIQRFLAANRHLISDEGFLYSTSAGIESQFGFVALANDTILNWKFNNELLNINSPEQLREYRSNLIKNLEVEFNSAPSAHTIIISSEHLHSRLRSIKEITVLKNILSTYADNFRVIVYFRRQDELAISYYSTKLKSGVSNPVLFPDRNPASDYYFNYLDIYNSWAAVFGENNITVREYNESKFTDNNLLLDFCENTGINYQNKNIPANVNLSLNNTALKFLTEINKIMPRVVNDTINMERALLIKFLESRYAGKPVLATRAQAMKFYERFRSDNMKLNTVLEKRGLPPLFNDDFNSYPENISEDSDDQRNLAAVSLDIWSLYQNEYLKNNESVKNNFHGKQPSQLRKMINRLFKL